MKLINRFVVGVILTLFIAVPTFAQVIEEITVTARKKEEALQDVAITVNALTGEVESRVPILYEQPIRDHKGAINLNLKSRELSRSLAFTAEAVV